jgi:hypothetical protein
MIPENMVKLQYFMVFLCKFVMIWYYKICSSISMCFFVADLKIAGPPGADLAEWKFPKMHPQIILSYKYIYYIYIYYIYNIYIYRSF